MAPMARGSEKLAQAHSARGPVGWLSGALLLDFDRGADRHLFYGHARADGASRYLEGLAGAFGRDERSFPVIVREHNGDVLHWVIREFHQMHDYVFVGGGNQYVRDH